MTSLSPALAALRLEELQLFVSVARLGGMAASARALGLAPSVVSRRIAQLEAALGVRLFQRTTRQLKLTAAGELALESAHLALDTLASAADTMAALADRPAGTVRLAAHHLAAEVLLPPLLREFAQRHPAIRVSLIATDALVNLVDRGFDAAIHAGQLPDSQQIALRLVSYRRILCASPDYLAEHGTPTTLDALASHRLLVHSAVEPLPWHFQHAGTAQRIAPPLQSSLEADSYPALLALARAGLGIVRVAQDVIQPDLDARRLIQILPAWSCVQADGSLPGLWLTYPSRQMLMRVRLLTEHLKQRLPQAYAPPRARVP